MQANPEHADLKEDEKKHHNSSFFWGIILIVLGLIFLFRNIDFNYGFFPSFFPVFSLHTVPWSVLFAIVLILLGIFYVVNVFKGDENEKIADKKIPHSTGTRFVKSNIDKKISGVCGGIAEHFSIDATIVRLGFVIFAILTGFFIGIITYIVLAIILPDNVDTDESNESIQKSIGGENE
ncbi:PspC domain-containing protein [bacterium]|nr:PspC domain-containing protein [bacterium]